MVEVAKRQRHTCPINEFTVVLIMLWRWIIAVGYHFYLYNNPNKETSP